MRGALVILDKYMKFGVPVVEVNSACSTVELVWTMIEFLN
jgi:hypothetical protein